jgi:carbon monoxide dehydrogenase subunit G
MRVDRSFTLHAPAEQVWAALTDPAALTGAIPGCERFEPGDGSARLTVTAAVAATTATYTVAGHVTSRDRPGSLALALEANGEPGALTGTVHLRLAGEDGVTRLSCEAEAETTGQLAAIGQALLAAAATRFAARLFEALDEQLTSPPAEPVPATDGPSAAADVPSTAAEPPPAPTGLPFAATVVPPAATDQPPAPAPARAAHLTRLPGQGFAPGVLVGAAIGIAATKLGSVLARRKR